MSEPDWVPLKTVSELRAELLARDGGLAGARDSRLLELAFARPRNRSANENEDDVITLAAIYTAANVEKRPCLGKNERTGFVVGLSFLQSRGWLFTASGADATDATLSLAAGTGDEGRFAAFLRAHGRPPDSPA